MQRALIRRSDPVIVLSEHVAAGLRAQGVVRPGVALIVAAHPPVDFNVSAPTGAHDGPHDAC